MDIFIEVTPGNNSVPAIRVRNDLVAISLPVSTTPASSISGLTPQVISGRTSRITTGSTKSAKSSKSTKSLNVIIHFPPDQVKGATDWYFQEMKKKMYVELRMKKKSEIYKACIDQNIAPPDLFGDEIKEGMMNDESYIKKFEEVAAKGERKYKVAKKKIYAKLHRDFYRFKKSKLDEESVETTDERIKVANETRSEYEYFKRSMKEVARQLNFTPV